MEVNFTEIAPAQPSYFFVPKDWKFRGKYDNGFAINEMFILNCCGIMTNLDKISVQFEKYKITQIVQGFKTYNIEDLKNKYHPILSKAWTYTAAKSDLMNNPILTDRVLYRPFDTRCTAYTGQEGFMQRPRYKIMQHFILGGNVGLCTCKLPTAVNWRHIFVTSTVIDEHLGGGGITYLFPLYLYKDFLGGINRYPNLNAEMVRKFESHVGLQFTEEKTPDENTFAPIDILDYIYGVLHSRKYRARYRECLRIGFPKIPYPLNREYFLRIAGLGARLRNLHLLNDVSYETSFPVSGTNVVSKPYFVDNRIYINEEQYFDGVSEEVWNFPIGGYIPAQKWLKDRKSRTLTADDIFHYQKILAAFAHTIAAMDKIDNIIELP